MDISSSMITHDCYHRDHNQEEEENFLEPDFEENDYVLATRDAREEEPQFAENNLRRTSIHTISQKILFRHL